MSTLAYVHGPGFLSGRGSWPAGDTGLRSARKAVEEVAKLKLAPAAWASFVFNDLFQLARECGVVPANDGLFSLAQRFLLALPNSLPVPELSMGDDGEINFDWGGQQRKMVTATLRRDGRLSYAAYFSPLDKDYGTKTFVDEVPKVVIDLVLKAWR